MLEEIKKEFEQITKQLFVAEICDECNGTGDDFEDSSKNCGECSGIGTIGKLNPALWQFIEQKLTEVIESYEIALAEVSKVYDNLTNGKLSKPNYQAATIIDEVRMIQENELTEAITQAKIEENEYWKRKIFHPNSIMPGISIMDFAIRINELKGE